MLSMIEKKMRMTGSDHKRQAKEETEAEIVKKEIDKGLEGREGWW